MIFRKARELGLQPRIIYPSKLTIYFQRKVWAFNKIDDFQEFVKKRPELSRNFDIQTHTHRKKTEKHEKINKRGGREGEMYCKGSILRALTRSNHLYSYMGK